MGLVFCRVHVVSDTVDILGLAEFLVVRRPQVETTVSGKEVVLYIYHA